jgi:hypothetical protein
MTNPKPPKASRISRPRRLTAPAVRYGRGRRSSGAGSSPTRTRSSSRNSATRRGAVLGDVPWGPLAGLPQSAEKARQAGEGGARCGAGFLHPEGPQEDLGRGDRTEFWRRDQSRQGPNLFASGADSDARRKIELRIAGALKTKADGFARYREKGVIGPNDSCIAAIGASQFAHEADAESGAGLPLPVTTVFPFGEEVIAIDPQTAEFASLSHKYSGEIERAKKEGNKPEAVARTAFQNDYFAGIDGLIWSRRS